MSCRVLLSSTAAFMLAMADRPALAQDEHLSSSTTATDCAIAVSGGVSASTLSVVCGLSGDELNRQLAAQTAAVLAGLKELLSEYSRTGGDAGAVTSAFWNISYDLLDKEPDAPAWLQKVLANLAGRLNADRDVIVGAHVLWVDDRHPLQNLRERRTLQGLGMSVDTTRNTAEALRLLSHADYDVVISDASRESDATAPCYPDKSVSNAGCALLSRVAGEYGRSAPPMILYAAEFDRSMGIPPLALGMTNRVDELLGLVLDGLERRHPPTRRPPDPG